MSETGVPKDGRAARSYRARLALAEALLDLLNAGVEQPTAALIADRAGVSLRLVFHHFDDLEAIYASAGDLQIERVRNIYKPIDPDLPFDERLAAFVKFRAKALEYVTPVRHASIRLESSSPEVSRRMRAAHQLARGQALQIFAHELGPASDPAYAITADALDSVSSWEIWDFLRRRVELPVKQATRVIELMIRRVLKKDR